MRFGNAQGDSSDVFVARFRADGPADTSFDTDGLVVRDFGSNTESATGLAVDSSGRAIVSLAGVGVLSAARFNMNGRIDRTFGKNGVAKAATFSGDASDVLIQDDGKIVIAGSRGTSLVLARFDATHGALDDSFSDDGISDPIPFAAGATTSRLASGPDSTILIAGTDPTLARRFSVARFIA